MTLKGRIVNKFWKSFFTPKSVVKLKNSKFYIPRLMANSFYPATYKDEPWLLETLHKINKIRYIESFIDIGVNIGQTLLKIKSINSDSKYLGFEPNPYCCYVVEQIISINKIPYCNIIPVGLGDTNSLVKLTFSEKNNLADSSATIVEGFRDNEYEHFQYVSVVRLDDFSKNLPITKIDVIKIDIEGAELEAIKGMTMLISRFNPIIIIEVLPSYSESNSFRINRQNELFTIVKDLGYKVYHIKNKIGELSFVELDRFPIHSNVEEADYLMLPSILDITDLN
ncbi:MAG: FkbM family methyltransferase [Cyclobacteriaceae bacterium]|nr:FkbM family methyltransferase [Cyclobacteriaceae bacterium]